MDIKEIALRIAESIDDGSGEQYFVDQDGWITEFAEALIAELAKQNKPAAWAIYITGDLCDVFQNKDFALLEFNRRNQLYPEPSREFRGLYTLPPIAEQIANGTVEAIAEYCRNQDHYCLATEIENGAWKEFKK